MGWDVKGLWELCVDKRLVFGDWIEGGKGMECVIRFVIPVVFHNNYICVCKLSDTTTGTYLKAAKEKGPNI